MSVAGLVGGGSIPRPGEVSLAHRGVLFLDEMPEFPRSSLEALRQPLEDGRISVCRAQRSVSFPASFTLIGAMNPCPCGFLGDTRRDCECATGLVDRYRARLSGPLLDRIDIHVEVPALGYRDLLRSKQGEPSADVRDRVVRARAVQIDRANTNGGPRRNRGFEAEPTNAALGPDGLRRFVSLDARCRTLLERAVDALGLSARAHDRVLRVARTLADLEGEDRVRSEHLSEAIHYRTLDRPVA